MHVARETLRCQMLQALELRRPRQYEGVGEGVVKGQVNDYMHSCTPQIKKSLLLGVLTGAVRTADQAHRRGLRGEAACPYCNGSGEVEDEDHLLWGCTAWDEACRHDLRKLTMMMSRVPELPQDPKLWPPCLRLCGLPPRSLLGGAAPELLKMLMGALLDMFAAVLTTRMLVEKKEDLLFDRKLRTGKTYQYGDLYGPLPKRRHRDLLVIGDPPRAQWKWEMGSRKT